MPFEFEALVGHLYVVGGRSINSTPPGLLVEVAPEKAARGREADTYFTLVLPAGDTVAPAAFYEQMSQVSAERYFSSAGSVTAGLRSVFTSLNDDLVRHNETSSRRYEVSILSAVLKGTDLYVGRVGAGVGLYRYADEMQTFPGAFTSEDVIAGPPLGAQPVPDIRMAHYQVIAGTRLVLADPALAGCEMDKLNSALSTEDVAAVLVALKDILTTQGTVLAVEFVPPNASFALPVREAESTSEINGRGPASEPDSAANGADTERAARKQRTPNPLAPAMQTVASMVALGAGRMAQLAARGLDHLLPQAREGQRSFLSTPAAAAATILIPIMVVVLVVVLWVSGTGQSEFELCVREATTAVDLARSLPSSDVAGTLAAWNAVLTVAARCEEIHAGDLTLAVYTREGRDIIDRLLQVNRRALTPLTSFPNAALTRLVLQGEDLYALDDRNHMVYRVKVSSDGRSLVPGSQQPIPSMRQTARVGAFTIGELFDILWAVDGRGLSQGNVLIGMDRNGVLVECPPRFLDTLSCDAQQLPIANTWVAPKAITMWQDRLYILDPGANQIWRYEPSGGAYANSPTEYFVGSRRPDIRTAVDFDIDANGNVYLLFAEGAITKFSSGEQVPFGFASFPDGQQIMSANALFLNNNPLAQGLMIVDQETRTVFETTLAGTFIGAYRPQDESLFTTVTDVVVDANQRMIYAASGNTIFAMSREG